MSKKKYTPEMCTRLVRLMQDGMAIVEVAADFGVNRRTIYAWEKDPNKPEFAEAISLGRTLSEAWWVRHGRLGTIGALAKFNANSWMYTMKCRFGKKWLQDNTSQINVSNLKEMGDADIEAALKELLNQDESK